ncbi:GNAT family N-acetyltransferase [Gordonia sp. (in: high G+C Gram-positive bacteria)]|uniref:GNAT family N-acetyltransferase n=2 Tax=Gordonia sp. (in: high G+C Gram-positive bacteria) TaxID=84139 RepID=UPI003C794276
MSHPVHSAGLADMDPLVLHDLIRLRIDTFVVEQDCAYAELDGLDVDPTTTHLWCVDADGRVTATLRILNPDDGDSAEEPRIGRVCVRRDMRGTGLIQAMMDAAVAVLGDRSSILYAQKHLVGMYEKWGYRAYGSEFVENGIVHVPMRRDG